MRYLLDTHAFLWFMQAAWCPAPSVGTSNPARRAFS